MSWTYREATVTGRPVFRITNPDTAEIREFPSFTSLVDGYDEAWRLLGQVARTLGPDVLQRWEDGDESLDLAAKVRARERRLARWSRVMEATSVQRGPGPWRWPRLVEVMVSDSWDTLSGARRCGGEWRAAGPGARAQLLESLYHAGYAVVRPRP